ncbi:hypothetical protein ACFWBF_30990 [Streptomyces sp. NPDC060028]|uniref:hypothetical protein n=1 Tax=Streptomyces sp. NPDC060028 TaxID=3347041 RepID=UPI0036A217B1
MVPSAIVLSHDEQRSRLARDCPEALPYAHVVGDPCADQLDASAPFRTDYRAALEIRPEQKLLLITSTWSEHSVLGSAIDFVERALAELPYDEFRVVAAVHPNAWYAHGGFQIRQWLERARRAGLILPQPAGETWKAAICAADAFVGDHGSLSLYAAARGLPGLLAAFDEGTVAPGSPMAWLGGRLPRVDPVRPLAEQLARAVALPGAAARITSRPGRALALLRTLCYRHLNLPEPDFPVLPRPVAVPGPATARSPLSPALYVDTRVRGREVRVRRHPAELQGRAAAHLGADVHVLADAAEPDPRLRGLADVLVARPDADPAEVFDRNPDCALVALGAGAGAGADPGRLVLRGGRRFGVPADVEPALAASALLALMGEGLDPEGGFTLRAGGATSILRFTVPGGAAGQADAGLLGPDAAQ